MEGSGRNKKWEANKGKVKEEHEVKEKILWKELWKKLNTIPDSK